MRIRIVLVCISLLLVLPVIKGCNEAHTGSGSGSASGSPVSNEQIPAVLDNPDEAGQKPGNEAPDVPGPEPGNEVSASPTDAKEPQILIVSNKETAAPYVHWSWNETLTGSGWVSADGMHLADILPDIADELPTVYYSDDFAVQYKENVSFCGLSVFDSKFEPLHRSVDLSYLDELSEGTYFAGIEVTRQGDFIEAEEKHESYGYDCVFKLMVKK